MTEVVFYNSRFDPDLTPFHDLAKAIAELSAIIINMNLWTRLTFAQGATPEYK